MKHTIYRTIRSTLIVACVLAGASACSSQGATPSVWKRVVIEFRVPVDGSSSDLVARLTRRAEVEVGYIASVTPARHVYKLNCPPADPECNTAIARLNADAAIERAAPDTLRHPSE